MQSKYKKIPKALLGDFLRKNKKIKKKNSYYLTMYLKNLEELQIQQETTPQI